MNTKQLQYVILLSRELSFTYAAEKLNITQSSLSQYIKKIETEAGAELFSRKGSSVELTQAGEAYVAAAKKILETERNLKNDISDIVDCTRGTIQIGISPYRCSSIMPGAVYRFRQEYPNIRVVLDERITAGLIDGIRGGEFDFCVASLPPNISDLDFRLLPNEEILLAVPKDMDGFGTTDDGTKSYPVVDIAKCDGLPFITQRGGQAVRSILDDLVSRCGIDVKYVAECVNMETIHAMVYHGVGCAIIPQWLARQGLYSTGISYYSIKQDIGWTNAVFWQKTQRLTKPMKYIISLLCDGAFF